MLINSRKVEFMAHTEDRRVRKTKRAMIKALAELLMKKPLASISVREIAENADINRGTFYLHYRDVEDMAEKLQAEIFEEFNRIVDRHEADVQSDRLFPMLAEIFNLLLNNAELACVLISKNGGTAFINSLKTVLRDKCFANAHDVLGIKNNDEFDYFYNYTVNGCIGICSAWLMGGMKETPMEMADFTERLITKSVEALR